MISKAKQVLMTLSILIVLSFFVFYAISVFYEGPEYQDFCPHTRAPKLAESLQSCEADGGKWNSFEQKCPDSNPDCPQGYCEIDYYCRKDYDAIREVYERNVFIVSMIIGVILLFTGLMLKGASVSTGIMGGGVVILFIALARYWGMLSKYIRLITLAVILALLIWIGYTKVDKMKEEPRRVQVVKKKSRSSKKKAKRKNSKKRR